MVNRNKVKMPRRPNAGGRHHFLQGAFLRGILQGGLVNGRVRVLTDILNREVRKAERWI